MKRLGLTLVAAVCLTATTFAAGNQLTTAKWEGNINVNKLSKYLNLSVNQQRRGYKHLRILHKQMCTCRNGSKKKSGNKRAQCSVRKLEIDEEERLLTKQYS